MTGKKSDLYHWCTIIWNRKCLIFFQVNENTQDNKENGLVSQKVSNKPQKKAGIAGMFANQAKKTEKSPVKKVEPEKEIKEKEQKTSKVIVYTYWLSMKGIVSLTTTAWGVSTLVDK